MRGFEVSKCQQNVIWPKTLTGHDFVLIAVSGGPARRDPMFERHYACAKAVRLPVGVRLCLYHLEQADKHAEELLDYLASIKGKEFEFPVYLSYPDGDYQLGKVTLTKRVIADVDAIREAGFRVGLSASADWIDKRINVSLLPEDVSLLCVDPEGVNAHGDRIDVIQYTSSGAVPGIAGQVSLIRTVSRNPMPTLAPEIKVPKKRKRG
jgi:GH25 family lysozyme M1 (1,4-beta-N-acetylmuramidase)